MNRNPTNDSVRRSSAVAAKICVLGLGAIGFYAMMLNHPLRSRAVTVTGSIFACGLILSLVAYAHPRGLIAGCIVSIQYLTLLIFPAWLFFYGMENLQGWVFILWCAIAGIFSLLIIFSALAMCLLAMGRHQIRVGRLFHLALITPEERAKDHEPLDAQ